jgi:hypothetical protein
MKEIMSYIGYIMGVLGFAGVVWTMATKTANKDYNVANLKADVTAMKDKMATKDDLKILKDSIFIYTVRVEQKVNEVTKGQNALRRNFVEYIKRDKTLKLDDFLKFMNGIEWVIQPVENKSDTGDVKIKIRKLK